MAGIEPEAVAVVGRGAPGHGHIDRAGTVEAAHEQAGAAVVVQGDIVERRRHGACTGWPDDDSLAAVVRHQRIPHGEIAVADGEEVDACAAVIVDEAVGDNQGPTTVEADPAAAAETHTLDGE